MTFFILAYVAGVLTIATPCIFPILPFVLAGTDEPFRRGALPMLLGLALAFAAVASLASVAGGWAVEANRYGRTAAFVVMTLFGLTLLLPTLAARMTSPIVSVGSRLANWAEQPTMSAPACSPPRWPCSPLPCWPLPKGDRGLRRHHRRDLEAV